MQKEQFKTSVGGQAVLEGVMMKGPEKMALAVRNPQGEIIVETENVKSHKWAKLPFIRGIFVFCNSLLTGYKTLMRSAEISMGDDFVEEDSKFDKWISEKFGEKGTNLLMGVSAILGGGLAIVLFMVLPTMITGLVNNFFPLGGFKALLEGVLKMTLFLGYLAVVSRMKEIRRVFMYHGAEHKTIACYEHGEDLTVENVRKHLRFHPRCGTSFLLIVMVVSILLFSVLPWTSTFMRVVLKLITLPLVMGIAYELIKLAGRFDNLATRMLSAPGLWLQRLTTVEPTDDMIEVAIASVLPVLPANKEDGQW
ncbi:MAG: DUF1385 domain-containing protein [Oscillospiraceae bacterium]|nr:DUF1385 domain-containing protein [Oscillospiraceae bacterium]